MSCNVSSIADLPVYLQDIKWKIDQKRKLVVTGTSQIQVNWVAMLYKYASVHVHVQNILIML